ncbi:hypothetical protein [Bacillus sp. B1-b2]|uniref:hypothetical protein n=1 Tax=Bacillus sp. B1-b2 TaxID=2653201 RepID=UPI001261B37C|nr:hypothetical protein [Bacillus sp. B1-b2]KAB7671183.1 hypothetical protein F9279_06620 [Bacillus sp. B1-b2]
MTLLLQSFTTTANTVITADSAGGPIPKTPVLALDPALPYIDGNNSYIWSPLTAPSQNVTFRTTFSVGAPLLSLALPLAINYAFAGDQNVSVSGTLQVLNLLGIVVLTLPLFTNVVNIEGNTSVEIASADTILAAALLGGTINIFIDATVVAPPVGTGNYLGQMTVRSIV